MLYTSWLRPRPESACGQPQASALPTAVAPIRKEKSISARQPVYGSVAESGPPLTTDDRYSLKPGAHFRPRGAGRRRRRIGRRRRGQRGLRPLLPGRLGISGLIRGEGGDEVLEEGPVGCERRKLRYRITVTGSTGSGKYSASDSHREPKDDSDFND
jgi:hypothetical protein